MLADRPVTGAEMESDKLFGIVGVLHSRETGLNYCYIGHWTLALVRGETERQSLDGMRIWGVCLRETGKLLIVCRIASEEHKADGRNVSTYEYEFFDGTLASVTYVDGAKAGSGVIRGKVECDLIDRALSMELQRRRAR